MVTYNRKPIEIEDLPEGTYFVRLSSHKECPTRPPTKKGELKTFIEERSWNESQVIVESGELLEEMMLTQ